VVSIQSEFESLPGHKNLRSSYKKLDMTGYRTYKCGRCRISKSNTRKFDHDMDRRFKFTIDKPLSALAFKILYYRDQLSKILAFLTAY
jgi:hypothetical protein